MVCSTSCLVQTEKNKDKGSLEVCNVSSDKARAVSTNNHEFSLLNLMDSYNKHAHPG